MGKKTAFDNFTNLYELSKTLRFELKPTEETKKMLKDDEVFEKDKLIQKKYEQTKPFFDRLHREFIDEALSGASLSGLEEYRDIFNKWTSDKKNKEFTKEVENREKSLRKQMVKLFDNQAAKWADKYSHLKIKKKDRGVLFEKDVFSILKERYEKEENTTLPDQTTGEIVSIFDSWKGFVGYFDKFFETRKNFYKDDGTETAIATRAIDQNLRRFCENSAVFERIREKVNISEVEDSFGESFSEVFSLGFYNECLLQGSIDEYNEIIGGKALKNGGKQKGINEYINLYRQSNKGERIPLLKSLHKQIASEKDEKFFDEIKGIDHLREILREFHRATSKKVGIARELISNFTNKSEGYDLKEVYLSKEAVNTISYKWVSETDTFQANLFETLKNGKVVKKSDKKNDEYSFPDWIALSYIREALEKFDGENFWKPRYYKFRAEEQNDLTREEFDAQNAQRPLKGEENVWEQFLKIFSYEFNGLFERKVTDPKTGKSEEVGYNMFLPPFESLLENFLVSTESKVVIKNYADAVLRIYQMMKYFSLEKKREWNPKYLEVGDFYLNPDIGYEKFYKDAYEEIVQPYNKIRNYLTKKPFSEKKWKLNFENPTLANGWDKNKEKDNFAVILRKDGQYHLGLMRKGSKNLFDNRREVEFSQHLEAGKYEKMVYKYLPDPSKMMPKVCFSKKGIEFFNPSREIMDIYKKGTFKKGDDFLLEDMQRIIEFYRDALVKYPGWKQYDFKDVHSASEYKNNIGEFFRDVSLNGYKISFQNIAQSYIEEKNKNGELYLFRIHSKDWNLKDRKLKTGTKNLHTLYFESLFSDENIARNFPMKLNGQAELFFRPKTKEEKLEKKNDSQGREVIDHKRYAQDKIFLHLPMTLNRGRVAPFNFNAKVNEMLIENKNGINIIGVDRGEKHLAYYSVITQSGAVLESGSLNSVGRDAKGKPIRYGKKLEKRAQEKKQSQRDWQEAVIIKNLKKGYVSEAARKLAYLAIKHNAIIVLEDLNMRFKQIRGGVEKSAYQQLEKALIEKMSFLVDKKEIDPKETGHLFRALQLAAPFESFQKMGKQTGTLFYTQAPYTSRIDPLTGWRPNLYLRYSNALRAKEDIEKFSRIVFVNGRFEFSYDLKKFGKPKDTYPKKTEWTLCSCVERYRWDRRRNGNKGGYEPYKDLTENFTRLFEEGDIDINEDILKQIRNIDEKERKNAKFFRNFIFLWGLLCQIRNTASDEKTGEDANDFIFSPVEPFFDSRYADKFNKNLPKSGDENGAYNIARKGIIILRDKLPLWKKEDEALRRSGKKGKFYPDLYISHNEWDDFAQKNDS